MDNKKHRKRSKGGKGNNGDDGGVISDPRFQRVHRDPRFQRLRKSKSQTVVDARFQRMFTDEDFNVLGGAVDKRGRPMRKDAGVDELRKLYRTGEEEKRPEDINVEETARKTAKRDINITAKLAHLNAVARGEVQIGSSSSSEDSSDSEDEDIDLTVSDKVLALPQAAREPAARTTQEGEETCRLAVVNMDWEHVRAVDVFAALQSFCPPGSQIERVDVIPSEYGKQRMAEEEKFGPSGLWDSKKKSGSVGSSSEDEEEQSNKKQRKWRDGGFDKARLRQYELNKLKYYYAVVTCDSPSTANAVYTQCDGMEYERTSNIFDLQFIPDDVKFENEPRDSATDVPRKYTPQLAAAPTQKTLLEPTWDQPDVRRVKRMRWEQENPADLKEDSFKAYLASSGSEDSDDSSIIDPDASDSDAEGEGEKRLKKLSKKQLAIRNKYKSLLGGLTELSDEEGADAPSLDYSAGKEILQKMEDRKARANETVFEAQQRKAKEKRKAKKAKQRQQEAGAADGSGRGEVLPGFFVDESLENDPFFAGAFDDDTPKQAAEDRRAQAKKDRAARKAAKEAERKLREREQAELELLMMDSNATSAQGFDKRAIVKAEKAKKSKRGRKRRRKDAEDDFHPDVQDPRFSAVFEDSRYAIDPTHAQFKDTREMREILAERQRRRSRTKGKRSMSGDVVEDVAEPASSKDVSALVQSLKKKLPKKARQAKTSKQQGGTHVPATEVPSTQRGDKKQGKTKKNKTKKAKKSKKSKKKGKSADSK